MIYGISIWGQASQVYFDSIKTSTTIIQQQGKLLLGALTRIENAYIYHLVKNIIMLT
jgi:hypothetical protein